MTVADVVPVAVAETAVAATEVTTVPVAAAEPVEVTETVEAVLTVAVTTAEPVSGAPNAAESPAETGPCRRGPIPTDGAEG